LVMCKHSTPAGVVRVYLWFCYKHTNPMDLKTGNTIDG